jgi:hypothetical protein
VNPLYYSDVLLKSIERLTITQALLSRNKGQLGLFVNVGLFSRHTQDANMRLFEVTAFHVYYFYAGLTRDSAYICCRPL